MRASGMWGRWTRVYVFTLGWLWLCAGCGTGGIETSEEPPPLPALPGTTVPPHSESPQSSQPRPDGGTPGEAPVDAGPTPVPDGGTPPPSDAGTPPHGPPAGDAGTPGDAGPPPASPAGSSHRRGSFYAGVAPEAIAVGDFNRDGAPDLAISAAGRGLRSQYVNRRGRVFLLLNDGRGGLAPSPTWRHLHSTSGRIEAGDANGDGLLDVVVGTRHGALLMLGGGDGYLGPSSESLGGGVIASLGFWQGGQGTAATMWAVGGFDHFDFPSGHAGFDVLRHLGESRFAREELVLEDGSPALSFLQEAVAAAVADFNEDGHADVALARERWDLDPSRKEVSILLGDASGRMRPGVPLLRAPQRLMSADFNRDGHADLLALEEGQLSVLLGDGRGGFSPGSEPRLALPLSDMAVVHLGDDGLPDVVGLHREQGQVSLLRGRGDGRLVWHSQLAVGQAPSAAAVADLDGDGTRELLVAESDDNALSVYDLPKAPTAEPPLPSGCPLRVGEAAVEGALPAVLGSVQVGESIGHVAVGDFDADGRRDLALALKERGVRLLLHAGDGTFTLRDVATHLEARSIAAGDFDGDGRADLVGFFRQLEAPPDTSYFPSMRVLWNDAREPFLRTLDFEGFGEDGGDVLAEDFNGDGRMDVASTLATPCTTVGVRYTNLGTGAFRRDGLPNHNGEPDDNCGGLSSPVAADFNGDGTLDLVHLTLGLNLNLTEADGSTVRGQGFEGGHFSARLSAADVDGDGHVDLVEATRDAHLQLHRGDGQGTLRAPVSCALPTWGDTLAEPVDLNADGIPDLLGTMGEERAVVVMLGEGGGRYRPAVLAADPRERIVWVKPVDLLGDVRPELVVLLASGTLQVFPAPPTVRPR